MRNENDLFVTSIHGLDTILGGGFLKGRLYLIEGDPGSGKTILGNQLAFANAQMGKTSLFVTLLSENQGKMLEHLREFDFYADELLNDKIFYLSGLSELSSSGLGGFKKFLTQSIRSLKVKLVVIDGFKVVKTFASSELEYSTFLHDLNSLASTLDCIFVILNPHTTFDVDRVGVLTDGYIELKRTDIGMRNTREIYVHKMRGMDHFEGRHELRISRDGIRIFPRIELLVARIPPFHPNLSEDKKSFGIENLDRMLKGGVLEGSVTSLFGPPGSGKTLIGLKFLHEGLLENENTLYFGFYETRDQMLSKASGVGLDFVPFIKSGQLEYQWYAPTEQLIDELYEKLITTIEGKKISRVFIDGIEGFKFSAVFADRLPRFITSLTIKLRSIGVTVIFSEEASMPSIKKVYHLGEYSAAFENIIYLRYVESNFHVKRLINIYKVRSSSYDLSIHEFHITNHGVEVQKESFKDEGTP